MCLLQWVVSNIVGWLERSETQQINEFLGERVKFRVSRESSHQLSAVSYQIKTQQVSEFEAHVGVKFISRDVS